MMQPAEQAAAAFSNDHLDIDVGGFAKRLAIMEALAALIRREREAVREACAAKVERAAGKCQSLTEETRMSNLAHALRALPVD